MSEARPIEGNRPDGGDPQGLTEAERVAGGAETDGAPATGADSGSQGGTAIGADPASDAETTTGAEAVGAETAIGADSGADTLIGADTATGADSGADTDADAPDQAADEPAEGRFGAVHRTLARLPHPVRVVGAAVVGGALVLAGLAMLVLPGPGIVVILAGLAVLATEFVWARRILERTKAAAKAGLDKGKAVVKRKG